MDGSWRPLCHAKQWSDGRRECERCPFKASCRKESAKMRSAMWAPRKEARRE